MAFWHGVLRRCGRVPESTLALVGTTQRHPEAERPFGRDGISGLLDASRALRAREVSRPGPDDLAAAEASAEAAIARGRLSAGRRSR